MRSVAVAGAGLAGLRAAEALRRRGFDGELTLVGEEPHKPYNRPPLSKDLLAGRSDAHACAFPVDGLDAQWLLGRRAERLDLDRRRLVLDEGDELAFDGLVIATGARARRWPGLPLLEGIFYLRRLDDALALRAAIAAGPRVAIVGAGFIGCEVAATLRGHGLDVTLIDVAAQPMPPLGPRLGALCAQLHRDHGVRLRLGTSVEHFAGAGRVEALELTDGTRVQADLVLLALGAQPNTEWLAGSGLTLAPGVLCDARCMAIGAERVAAAGDVAQWPHPLVPGEQVRIEHWSNAAEQARVAAPNLLLEPQERAPYTAVPSFWSDQYDVKIQSVGFLRDAGELRVVEEAPEERKLVAEGERDGRLVAAVAFNRPARMAKYRRALQEELSAAAAG